MITSDTVLVLVNAIYFKGDWDSQFKKDRTRDEPFHVTADRSVKTPMPLVRSIADDVTVISAGQICERGPVTEVLTAPREAYTRQLIADVPGFEHAV
jgi:hypothetical protein